MAMIVYKPIAKNLNAVTTISWQPPGFPNFFHLAGFLARGHTFLYSFDHVKYTC